MEKLAIIHSWKISKDVLLEFFEDHKKKNVGPITFHYEKSCTVFHGIEAICRRYNDLGVGLDCGVITCIKHFFI